MKTKISILLSFLLGLFFLLNTNSEANAQDLKPVKWETSSKKISDNRYQVIFTATIDKNWYLYSQNLGEGGPIPTTFTFNEKPEYSIKGEVKENGELIDKFDNLFNMQIKKYANEVQFVADITTTGKKACVEGSIEFMSCDAERCLPPENYDFKVKLK